MREGWSRAAFLGSWGRGTGFPGSTVDDPTQNALAPIAGASRPQLAPIGGRPSGTTREKAPLVPTAPKSRRELEEEEEERIRQKKERKRREKEEKKERKRREKEQEERENADSASDKDEEPRKSASGLDVGAVVSPARPRRSSASASDSEADEKARRRAAKREAKENRFRKEKEAASAAAAATAAGSYPAGRPPLRRYQRPPQPHKSKKKGHRREPSGASATGSAGDESDAEMNPGVISGIVNMNVEPSSAKDVYFVENPNTGEFRKVERSQIAAERERANRVEEDVDRETVFKRMVDSIASVVALVFISAQGLLAGFALMHFFLLYVRFTPHVDFLRFYSPIASDCQRVYFVLTTLSLLGAIDKYSKDKMAKWHGTTWRQQVVDFCLVLAYLAAFAFSLAAAQTDELIYYANERVPGWYDAAPLPQSFLDIMTPWYVFNTIRIAASIFAWVLIATEIRTYDMNRANKELFAIQLRSTAAVGPRWTSKGLGASGAEKNAAAAGTGSGAGAAGDAQSAKSATTVRVPAAKGPLKA